jgi:Bacteriophage tail tube protein
MNFTTQPVTLEAANVFCGAQGGSQHLRLMNVKLPSYEEVYVDHKPGGAPIGIEVDILVNKLQCDFTLVGWTPKVDALIGSWQGGTNLFWFYGALRDRLTGQVYQVQATMTGRLGKAAANEWQRGSINSFSYSIRSLIAYKLEINPNTDSAVTMIEWDFFNNTLALADYTS